jgi:hypothetical protein
LDAGQLSLRSLLLAGVQKPAQKRKSAVIYRSRRATKTVSANGLSDNEDVVDQVISALDFNHLAHRLHPVEPTVALRFCLECWSGDQITIAGSQHFSSYQPIKSFLLKLYDAVVGNENDLAVVRLNGEPHVEPTNAIAHSSRRVAGWWNYLSLYLRTVHPSVCVIDHSQRVVDDVLSSASGT